MMRQQRQVRDWERAVGYDTPDAPIPLEQYNGDLRVQLILEEARECDEAWRERDRNGYIDALADTLFVVLGAAVDMGINLEPFFDEVVASNMTKVGAGHGEDGKLCKGDNFQPPDIEAVWDRLYGADAVVAA